MNGRESTETLILVRYRPADIFASMKPVNKYLLVEPITEEKKGSVFIPLSNNLPYKSGVVISVSDNVREVKPGDRVTYFRRGIAADKIDINNKFHDLITEETLMYID